MHYVRQHTARSSWQQKHHVLKEWTVRTHKIERCYSNQEHPTKFSTKLANETNYQCNQATGTLQGQRICGHFDK